MPEVIASGILLPDNAPKKFSDRQTLWNAVEREEKQWNSQLCRSIIMALPRELPTDAFEKLLCDYCAEQFVSKGMVVDYAIHDKGDGNPHAHVMLTMRAMDDHGKWLPKSHKVYELDENGERIRLPSGEWKSHKERTTDWDDPENAEHWRSAWAETVNRYYEQYEIPERIDLRSFERQGKEELPTVHLGPAVAHMEEKGIHTDIGDYNRQIKEHNSALKKIRRALNELGTWIKTATIKLSLMLDKNNRIPNLFDYVSVYQSMQNEGRLTWNARAQSKARMNDMKKLQMVTNFMTENNIIFLDDLNALVEERKAVFDELDAKRRELRKTETALKHIENFETLRPLYDQSQKGFKKSRERFAETYKVELEKFQKSNRYLKANNLKVDDKDRLKTKQASLTSEIETMENALRQADLDPEAIRYLRYCVDKVIEAGREPKIRQSVLKKLHALDELQKDKPRLEQKNRDHRHQEER